MWGIPNTVSTRKAFLSSVSLRLLVALLASGALTALGQDISCFETWIRLREQKLKEEPLVLRAKNTQTDMAFAFEKEGSWFPELPKGWFKINQDYMKRALLLRVRAEQAGKKEKALLDFLKHFLDSDDPTWIMAPAEVRRSISKAAWARMTPQEQIEFLFGSGDVTKKLTKTALGHLFYEEVLDFGRLEPGPTKPESIRITNDLGSYELVSRGETDRLAFQRMRQEIEDGLGGPIGHQHMIHDWPASREERAEIAPQYMELLDAGTWFLYWRQMERNPEEVESILGHEFLGIYPRRSLQRLHDRMVDGDSEHARDKYRMIGFRSMRGREEMPGQDPDKYYPDFELRSGNKGVKRDFMEDVLQARLVSGDYSGLRAFDAYQFDPAAPLEKMAPFLSPDQTATLVAFEKEIPKIRSDNRYYRADLRNKIFSPLLPWEDRLPFDLGGEQFARAQRQYAEALVEIGKDYVKRKARTEKAESHQKLWDETQGKIEQAMYECAKFVQLSRAFESYLTTRAGTLTSVLSESSGPMDVNGVHLGVERSF